MATFPVGVMHPVEATGPLSGAHQGYRVVPIAVAGTEYQIDFTSYYDETDTLISFPSGTTFVSSTVSSGTIDNAFDDSDGTSLILEGILSGTEVPHVGFVLPTGESVTVSRVRIASGVNTGVVQYTDDDGATWTTLWEFTGNVGSPQTMEVTETNSTFTGASATDVRGTAVYPRPTPEGPHAYWRVVTGTNGQADAAHGWAEIRFINRVADENVVGTVSAYTTFSGSPASNARDDDEGSNYRTQAGNAVYEIDLGSGETTVDRVELQAPAGVSASWAPLFLAVQYSDDRSTWYTKWVVAEYDKKVGGADQWVGNEVRFYDYDPPSDDVDPFADPRTGFDGGSITQLSTDTLTPNGGADSLAHRYWRLRVTAAPDGGASFVYVGEMSLKDSLTGTDLTSPGLAATNAIEGSNAFGNSADEAFSDDGANGWATSTSNIAGGDAWLGWDFGAGNAYAITHVEITAGNDADQTAEDFVIEYSDDNSTWTVKATATSLATWSASEKRLFTLT